MTLRPKRFRRMFILPLTGPAFGSALFLRLIMLQCFIGLDQRQPVAYSVAQHSLIWRCSEPVNVCPLNVETLPVKKVGLTPFTFTRWLVPWLMEGRGWALFMDTDVLILGDVAEVFGLSNDAYAVMVSKNPRHFEWPAVMLFNCAHEACKALTPEFVDDGKGLYGFKWCGGEDSPLIGELPREWNHLVGYDPPRLDAKLVHFTAGIPPFEETKMCEYSDAWHVEHQRLNASLPWAALMAQSVHATHLPDGRALPHFHPEVLAMKGQMSPK